jgi:phosphatidate cytidylyltransferase
VSAESAAGARWRAQGLVPRIGSTLVLAPVSVYAVWQGGAAFAVLVTVLLLVALFEFYRMALRAGHPVRITAGLVTGFALLLRTAVGDTGHLDLLLVLFALVTAAQSLAKPIAGRLAALGLTWMGLAYVVGLGTLFLHLRARPDGGQLLLLVVLATWAADVFAFFVGVRWGRRRLIPHVSPGKSVEGWIGGLVGSSLVTAIAARLLVPDYLHPLEALLIGALIGVAGPLGDLFESMVKRSFGAKDSSRIIPGHGGVLDRIDSLLFTVPLAHVLFTLLGRAG